MMQAARGQRSGAARVWLVLLLQAAMWSRSVLQSADASNGRREGVCARDVQEGASQNTKSSAGEGGRRLLKKLRAPAAPEAVAP